MMTSLIAIAGEHVPKPERLIPCSSDDSTTIWTHCEVEYSHGMAHQRAYFFHLWIFPYIDLVKRIAMGTDDFIYGLRKSEVADLGARINCFYGLAS